MSDEGADEMIKLLYRALTKLGATHELLSIVGSWRCSMSDDWVIDNLRDWLRSGRPLSDEPLP